MSNHDLIKRFDIIIDILENLPRRICDEMDIREERRKEDEIKRLKSDIDYNRSYLSEINKFMSGFNSQIPMDHNQRRNSQIQDE